MSQQSSNLRGADCGRRRLHCERLEHREMLAALLASAEIAPGPVAEFTTQAKSFIESALENVMVTQNQAPIHSSIDTHSSVTEDGLPVRVTRFTVEMVDRTELSNLRSADDGSANTLSTSNQSSAMSILANSQLSSQLVFSFVIYPDNAVSLRASFNNPKLAAYSLLDTVKRERSMSEELATRADRHARLEIDFFPTSQLGSAANSKPELRSDRAFEAAASKSRVIIESISDQEKTTSGDASPALAEDVPELTADQFNESQLDIASALAARHETRLRGIVATHRSSHLLADLGADSIQARLAAPWGMIGLELTDELPRTAASEFVNTSAVFQIMIQADGGWTVANTAAETEPDSGESFAESQGAEPTGWRNEPLAIGALVGGIWLTRRRRTSAVVAQQSSHDQSTAEEE